MAGPPSIVFSVSGQTANFDCTVQSAAESGTQYTVTWTSASSTLSISTLTTTLVDRLSISSLTATQKASMADNGLVCSVTASNPARCGTGISPALQASLDAFVPKVGEPSASVLIEGSTTATVLVSFGSISSELYCLLKYETSCTVTIQARSKQDLPNKCIGGEEVPALVVKSSNTGKDTCGGDLGAANSQMTLRIKAVSDGVVRPDRGVTIDVIQLDTAGANQTSSLLKKFNVWKIYLFGFFYPLRFKLIFFLSKFARKVK
jgi:hypothetical protein